MSFKSYPNVSESNIAWLGEIPSHWTIARVRHLFCIKKRIAGEIGHDILSITQSGIRIKDTESNDGQLSMDYSKYQLVYPGDYAMNHMDLLTGWIDIASAPGVTSPDYRVFAKRDNDNINSRYFLYIFQMGYEQELFYPLGQGSSQLGRWRLPSDAFNEFTLPVPPLDEQTAIAAFLDRETAKIDALVEEQRRLIALLKEKRQAVISHAVTKGLNPEAAMMDSGVEWLGEVPAHWEVKALKRAVFFQRGHDLPADDRVSGPIPIVSSAGISGYHDTAITSSATIVTGRYGSIGQFYLLQQPCWPLNTALYSVEIALPNPHFVKYLLMNVSHLFVMNAAKSAVPGVDRNDVHPLKVSVPPPTEQEQIVGYLQSQESQIDEAVSVCESAIDLLNERRAALISAAVTGKIDVRGSAKVLPFPVDRARARRLIAAEIIDRSAHQATFGRTKLQKLLYLVEAHANVNELAGRYVRMPYGPLDQDMIDEIEGAAADMGFAVDDPGNRKMVRYRPVAARGRSRGELAEWLGDDRVAKLDKLITDFADLDTRAAEAVATLYAVWNDALIDGETPSDDWIVNGFLTAWNKTKAENFDRHELPHRLGWMRRHGLVPTGAGPKTNIGGLFA
ncbi:restriction endonuclease subunit S [Methylopila turkensis]|uniref:Type I restriction modification DNA specificity domain-containing protein n=1 Tax=Methylopila turkensis TaxID=1437816 RepID=A0A9W6JNI2_9HYPH|nr:restriction endonuclease subunit S [Methylopila turkensis]GLK79085.1 hypothetical protein GCM10008174_08260 [Methylopila turkensis]